MSDVKPNISSNDEGLLLHVVVLQNSEIDEDVTEVANDRFMPVPRSCAFNIE